MQTPNWKTKTHEITGEIIHTLKKDNIEIEVIKSVSGNYLTFAYADELLAYASKKELSLEEAKLHGELIIYLDLLNPNSHQS
jgi:hypothetical protein